MTEEKTPKKTTKKAPAKKAKPKAKKPVEPPKEVEWSSRYNPPKKVGRPVKFTQARLAHLVGLMEDYIDKEEIPSVPGFTSSLKKDDRILKQDVYAYPEFSDSLRRLNDKREAAIEKLSMFNVINAQIAQLALIQPSIGWIKYPQPPVQEENGMLSEMHGFLAKISKDKEKHDA